MQLYTECLKEKDLAKLFEYSLDFVTQGIASFDQINEQITAIVEKDSRPTSPKVLHITRAAQHTFINPQYDLLIGGTGHSLEHELEYLIANEPDAIQIACYCLTNSQIARALILAAQKRHVKIEVIVDKECPQAIGHILDILTRHGIPVYISNDKEHMHNNSRFFTDKRQSGLDLLILQLPGSQPTTKLP